MRLELGNVSDILMIPRSHHNLPLMVNLQDTLKATVRTQTFSYRGLQATLMLSTMWEVRKGCGFSLTSCHNLLINTTTEGESMVRVKRCDCLQRRGLRHRHSFCRNHELIAFSMPNLHFLLQLQLTDFFIQSAVLFFLSLFSLRSKSMRTEAFHSHL